ncbi:hypothetical protein [Cupriavidus sp. RAF12]|uniref:hypothetical protein n=1 Tax=Cupriavidus sp. RAF12 TaxID=3233050 RepID=UPI003F90750E
MVDPTYQKTDAGQEEIRTRARKLDQKVRALLLIVNGERRKSDLLAQVGGMGVGEESFDTLLSLGLIAPSSEEVAPAAAAPVRQSKPAPQSAPADTNLFAAYSALGKGIDDVLADTTIAPPAPPARAAAAPDGYQQLYHFFTDVIGNHLGLRGYVMQVKVEKAGTIVELAALRDALGAALQKAKGDITARAIIDQLDAMLADMGVAPAR